MDPKLVLIVDDEFEIAQAYEAVLRSAGFEPQVLHDGQAAQARLQEIVPALVVLDLNLPRVSGRELLNQIRADVRLSQTRVIITTGDTQTASMIAGEGQADIILVKPVSAAQLHDFALRLRGNPAAGPGEGSSP